MSLSASNIELYAGTARNITIPVKDTDGNVVDLTGATIDFYIGRSTQSLAEYHKTIGDGITVAAPVTGEMVIKLEKTETADMNGEYLFQCKMTDQTGDPSVVAHGTITVKETLTEA